MTSPPCLLLLALLAADGGAPLVSASDAGDAVAAPPSRDPKSTAKPGEQGRTKEKAEGFDPKNLPAANTPADEAAKAKFQLALRAAAEFDAVPLSGRGLVLEQTFKRKHSRAKTALDAFGAVCALGSDEWCLAAGYESAHVLERFGDALQAAPCPPDLKAGHGTEGCETYAQALLSYVEPLWDKARGGL